MKLRFCPTRAALCRLLCLLLIACCVLSACHPGGGPGTDAPTQRAEPTDPTDPTTAAPTAVPTAAPTATPTDAPTDAPTEPATTAFPLVTVPTETVPLADGTDFFTADQLRITPYFFRTDRTDVVSVTEENGTFRLTPLGAGSDTVTVFNTYGETAGASVTVGADLKMHILLIPFVAPNSSFNVLEAGASNKGLLNSTPYIQKCINSASEAGGGTVYVPAGKYVISNLSMMPGVSLRFEGFVPDARVGYTDEVKAYAESDRIAYVKSSGASRSNFFFFNVVPPAYCTTGTSDFLISGGIFDCQAKLKMGGFACGNNITIENMIVKDNPNNHAFQIEGCSNVTFRNVMFAGYDYPAANAVLTRETIQLEPTTSGAIGSNTATNPIQCTEGDYHNTKNVTVTGCYFGKSDKYGPHLVALGHHSATGGESVDGLVFSDNVVDNPLYCGLHLLNAVNVRITGNRFISDKAATSAALGSDSALVSLYSKNSASTYTTESGKKVTYLINYELAGDRNYVIENNDFILGGGTFLRAVSVIGQSADYNLSTVYKDDSSTLRVEKFGGKVFACNGYVIKTNCMYNITLRGNRISVLSPIAYKDHFAAFSIVQGLFLEDNLVTLGDGVNFSSTYAELKGVSGKTIVTGNETFTRKATLSKISVRTATLCVDGKTYDFKIPSSSVAVTFRSDGHGEVVFTTDAVGNLTMTVVPFEGYVFAGWTDESGNPVTFTQTPEKSITVVSTFKPAA